MDELIIDDKKFISSKQAAKITGYAKDYVGQLCREGRVPAQLVGRSWYVLESAIKDHRFGDAASIESVQVAPQESSSVFAHAWEKVRYESAEHESLPQIARVEVEEEIVEEEGLQAVPEAIREEEDVVVSMPVSNVPMQDIRPLEPRADVIEEEVGEEVTVPEATPVAEVQTVRPRRRSRKALYALIRTLGIAIALLFAAVAAINSGYFDNYLGSFSRASIITGYSELIK
jgi:hypothetical protein